MLTRLRNGEVAVDLLAMLEFGLSRTEPVEPVRLTSGDDLEAIAGEGADGTFFPVWESQPASGAVYDF